VLHVVADSDTFVELSRLRSSPTPEGRCCSRAAGPVPAADAHGVAILTDPGGSVLREIVILSYQLLRVAILTDPGGSVLLGNVGPVSDVPPEVAILTDPGGSVLRGQSTGAGCLAPSSCDPHRPRRVGAAPVWCSHMRAGSGLRSSPTPEGRCCVGNVGPVSDVPPEVAILTDPGGSVLQRGDRRPHHSTS